MLISLCKSFLQKNNYATVPLSHPVRKSYVSAPPTELIKRSFRTSPHVLGIPLFSTHLVYAQKSTLEVLKKENNWITILWHCCTLCIAQQQWVNVATYITLISLFVILLQKMPKKDSDRGLAPNSGVRNTDSVCLRDGICKWRNYSPESEKYWIILSRQYEFESDSSKQSDCRILNGREDSISTNCEVICFHSQHLLVLLEVAGC